MAEKKKTGKRGKKEKSGKAGKTAVKKAEKKKEKKKAAEKKGTGKKAGEKKEKPKEKGKETGKKEKAEKSEEKVTEKAGKKEEKKRKEKEKPKAKAKAKKTREVLEKIKLIRKKRRLPVFRGRFGKKSVRKVNKKKWKKWRKARGIDIKHNKEDGAIVKTGYRAAKKIRGTHPCGYGEVLVKTTAELRGLPEETAIRISGKLGKKKRKELVKEANKMGAKILN